jgi:fatty acid amide hydrolase 2
MSDSSKIQSLSAFELANLIRKKEISSSELVSFYINQIQIWNPKLNALVEDCFHQALAEAKKCDEIIQNPSSDISKLPPLFGVPFTLKEMFAVAGMKSTSGSVYLKDQIMKENSNAFLRLKNAGAILLGTSNVPEVGFWFETYNCVYGRTNNPYNLNHSVGGSTGGEGALIGAGASPFGVGSDIGGSIRIPAAACGVFGHKPTWKSIPMTGHPPFYENAISKFVGTNYPMTTAGPLTKKAKDLRPLLYLLTGPDQMDRESNFKLKLYDTENPEITDFINYPHIDLRKLKLFILPDPIIKWASPTDAEQRAAIIKIASQLENLGAHVESMPRDIFNVALEIWGSKLSNVKVRNFQDVINPNGKVNYLKEYLLLLIGKGHHTLPILTAGLLDKYFTKSNLAYKKQELNKELLTNLDQHLKTLLGDNGVIIMPTHPRTAPKHNSPIFRPFDFTYTAITNALGYPATAVPIGLDSNGLPMSLQVIAAPFNDNLTLSIAERLEDLGYKWVPPT